MNREQIVHYFQACKHEITEETRQIRDTWDQLHAQYMCQKDFSKKERWQYKFYTPMSKPKIKKATRLIKRVMIRAGNYFDFEHIGNDDFRKQLCNITRRILKTHLNAAHFIDEFSESLEGGFTLGLMALKWWVGEAEDHFSVNAAEGTIDRNVRLKLKCKAINPFNLFFTRDKSIVIEDEWITLPELRKIADETKVDGKHVYNMNVVKNMISGDYGHTARMKDEDAKRLIRLGISEQGNDYRKEVLLSHFWGPLISKKNEVVEENQRFTIANEKYLILGPDDNPYWHKKPPYIIGSPLPVIFRHIGKGLTEDVRMIEDAIVDFAMMLADNSQWQQLGVRIVDETAFTDYGRSEARELRPGHLIRKRSAYQGSPFEFEELGADAEKAIPTLQVLRKFHEEDHGITEYIDPVGGGGEGRELATVYSGKRQEALGDFQSIAMDIERGYLAQNIDMARDLMIQYLADFESFPNITSILGEEGVNIDGLSDDQKRQLIVDDLDIVGKGISIFFDREMLINKLGSYVKMLNALPEVGTRYPNWTEILDRFNWAFNFDRPEDMIKSDEQIQKEDQQRMQQMMQQFQMQAQMRDKEHQYTLEEINAKETAKSAGKREELAVKLLEGM